MHALHYANELFVRVRFSVQKLLQTRLYEEAIQCLCYKRNGERAACGYRVIYARGKLLSTQEARVALGYRLVRLLRFFRA